MRVVVPWVQAWCGSPRSVQSYGVGMVQNLGFGGKSLVFLGFLCSGSVELQIQAMRAPDFYEQAGFIPPGTRMCKTTRSAPVRPLLRARTPDTKIHTVDFGVRDACVRARTRGWAAGGCVCARGCPGVSGVSGRACTPTAGSFALLLSLLFNATTKTNENPAKALFFTLQHRPAARLA